VVVVATGRNKGGRVAVGGRELEAQHSYIEVERLGDAGDLEVDMTDVGPGGDRAGGWVFRVDLMHRIKAAISD
jgi:hypothetical protein